MMTDGLHDLVYEMCQKAVAENVEPRILIADLKDAWAQALREKAETEMKQFEPR